MKSKLDTFNLVNYGLKIYIPDYRNCSMEFLKQILYGSKEPLCKEKVIMVNVPKWKEFKVRIFYDAVIKDERFEKFLPDLKA